MTENLSFAWAIDTCFLKAEEIAKWEHKFTYLGMQYVKLTGIKDKSDKNTITGIAFGYSTLMESTITSSDKTLNNLSNHPAADCLLGLP